MAQPQPFSFSKLPLELKQNVFKNVAARPGGSAAANNVLRRWFEKKEVNEIIAADTTGDTLAACYWDDNVRGNGGHDDSNEDSDEDQDEDEYEDQDDDQHDEDEDDEDGDGDVEIDGEDASDGDVEDAAPVRFVQPHTKWRHIPNFLRISECPPPVPLLQTCKDIHTAAMSWFYEVNVMEIDATGSFAHTSMFETALDQITEADYSPFRTIRKVKVLLVWDTEWLRGPDCNGKASFFEMILGVRINKVIEVLDPDKSPCLAELCIEWHDSVQDAESTAFKNNICAILSSLPVTVERKDSYLTPGQQPTADSLLGRKRLEFQRIADGRFRLM